MTTAVKSENVSGPNEVKVLLVNPRDMNADSLAPPKTLGVGESDTFYVYDSQSIQVDEIAAAEQPTDQAGQTEGADDPPLADDAGEAEVDAAA